MATNARQFSLQLERFSRDTVPETLGKVTRALGLEAMRRLVLRTPVDTGRARGGWGANIGAPFEGTRAGTDVSGAETIADGSSVIATARPFQTIHISSNVEYILPLENGSSQQAPAGMAHVTVEELKNADLNALAGVLS